MRLAPIVTWAYLQRKRGRDVWRLRQSALRELLVDLERALVVVD